MMPRCALGPTLLLAALLPGCSSSTTTTVTQGEPAPSLTNQRTPTPEPSRPPQPVTQQNEPKPAPKPAPAPQNPSIKSIPEAGLIRGRVLRGMEQGVPEVAVWVTAPELSSPEPSGPVTLTQAQGHYWPPVLVARQGQQLQLRTSDDRADFHASGAATFSDTLKKGAVRSHRLTTLGIIEVRSQLNPDMALAVVHVVAHDWHTLTEPDGSFRLPPLPPGEYILTLVYQGGPSQAGSAAKQHVSVKLGKGEGAAIEWTLPAK